MLIAAWLASLVRRHVSCMFRSLFAAVAQPAPAPELPPPPRPRRPPQQPIQPGLPRYLARSSLIRFGRCRQLRGVSDRQASVLHAALAPSTALQASRALAEPAPTARISTYIVDGKAFDVCRPGHGDHHAAADANLGLVSHLIAQASLTRRPQCQTTKKPNGRFKVECGGGGARAFLSFGFGPPQFKHSRLDYLGVFGRGGSFLSMISLSFSITLRGLKGLTMYPFAPA